MRGDDRTIARPWVASVALLTAVALTACGDVREEPPVGGAAAPDEAVTEDLEINSLVLEYPEDGVHEEGEDVLLYAALTNTGSTSYRLVDVEGPGFADARLVSGDGTEGAIEVPEESNAYLEPDGPPSVTLLGLSTSLRSSQSVEVTFVFEDAGEVTMEAPVAPESAAEQSFDPPEDTPSD